MSLPNQILVLLILVPILVQSQERCNGNNIQECLSLASRGECQRNTIFMQTNCKQTCNLCGGNFITGCNDNSQCSNNEICDRRRCVVDPCSRVQCPANTRCQVVQGNAQCQPIPGCIDNSQCSNNGICDRRRCVVDPCSRVRCPANTKCQVVQGNAQCQPIPGCSENSQCSNNEICDRERCVVDPCSTNRCGTNNKCVVVRGEIQCHPLPESLVFNRDSQAVGVSDDTLGSSQGGSTSGSTQGGNQAGVTQGVNQAGVSDGANQGSVVQGSNPGGVSQGGNQGGIPQGANQIVADQEGNQGDAGQGSNQSSPAQGVNQGDAGQGSNQSSPAQEGNQGDATHGANQSGSAQDGNQIVGSSAVTTEGTGNITNPPSPGSNRPVASVSDCRINSQCGSNKRCKSGSCVDPCDSVKCGLGALCQVSQRQPRCVCPAGTEGNPLEQCQPISDIQGCAEHSQCAENEQCDSGNCVNPCELIPSCGKGAKCQVLGRNPQCICPDNTQGDPFKQCEPAQALVVVFPGDKPTQIPPINVPGKETRNPGCLNVPDPGECRGAFKRFYYNEKTDQCDCFLFGGCDVEGVKFTWVTLEECHRICLPGNKAQGPGCKRATLDEVTLFLEEQRRNRENSRG